MCWKKPMPVSFTAAHSERTKFRLIHQMFDIRSITVLSAALPYQCKDHNCQNKALIDAILYRMTHGDKHRFDGFSIDCTQWNSAAHCCRNVIMGNIIIACLLLGQSKLRANVLEALGGVCHVFNWLINWSLVFNTQPTMKVHQGRAKHDSSSHK